MAVTQRTTPAPGALVWVVWPWGYQIERVEFIARLWEGSPYCRIRMRPSSHQTTWPLASIHADLSDALNHAHGLALCNEDEDDRQPPIVIW